MKKQIMTTVFLLILPALLWAHGGAIHVLGTVTQADDQYVIIKTPKGNMVSIAFNAETTFRYQGISRTHTRPQVGDRLIAEAAKKGDELVATEINFSTPKSQ